MLATDWCMPGNGATVRELLDWAPAYIIDSSEFQELKPYLNTKTALRLNSDSQGESYDLERIKAALIRVKAEPELCVILENRSGDWLEHVHFGGSSQVGHSLLQEWIFKSGEAYTTDAENDVWKPGALRITLDCPVIEEEIARQEAKQDDRG